MDLVEDEEGYRDNPYMYDKSGPKKRIDYSKVDEAAEGYEKDYENKDEEKQ